MALYLKSRPHSKARNLTPNPLVGDPPSPPGQVDPPPAPGPVNPSPNLGVLTGSNWEPGKIPTNEEEPKKVFSYRNPLYSHPSAPLPKVSDPIPPIPCKEQKPGGGEPVGDDPSGSGGVILFHLAMSQWVILREIHLWTKSQNHRLPPRRGQSPLKTLYAPPGFLGGT